MRVELQAYMDGEIDRQQLPDDLLNEAANWERLLEGVRELDVWAAPVGLEARILEALALVHDRPLWRRAAIWALRPHIVRVAPAWGLAAAASAALVLLPTMQRPAPPTQPFGTATIFVQFALKAPGARSVAVAGDFNEWTPKLRLRDIDGDGVWTGRLALRPGLHQYMFVIDGALWMTDPHAERYLDDGFGNQNAVVIVTSPTTRSGTASTVKRIHSLLDGSLLVS
ncbi:MAG TPA: isoamylase early set domain-containing protein [Gemmatimonadota bacterium]|nr:isoamylase early set domain-containing protein [Gemmatimonadota bacterium]